MKKVILVLLASFFFTSNTYALDVKNLNCSGSSGEITFQYSASFYDVIFHKRFTVYGLDSTGNWHDIKKLISPTVSFSPMQYYKMSALDNIDLPLTSFRLSTSYQVLELGNCT